MSSLGGPYTIELNSIEDYGLKQNSKLARKTKEKTSILSVKDKRNRYKTLQEVHNFIYTEHGAYNVAQQDEFGQRDKEMTNDIFNSY